MTSVELNLMGPISFAFRTKGGLSVMTQAPLLDIVFCISSTAYCRPERSEGPVAEDYGSPCELSGGRFFAPLRMTNG